MAQLTQGALAACRTGECKGEVILRVTELKQNNNNKWIFKCFDGSGGSMEGVLATQVMRSTQIKSGDVVRATDYQCNLIGEGSAQAHKLIISACQVVASDDSGAARDQEAPSGAAPSTPTGAKTGGGDVPMAEAPASQQQQTPPVAKPAFGTPGPTPSPSEEVKRTPVPLPLSPVRGGPAGPSSTPPSTAGKTAAAERSGGGGTPISVRETRANVQPIAALNPYDTQWTIKAKVIRKMPARSFAGRGGQQQRTFTVELADAQRGQVQATFWREAVEKYYDALSEGKVYYISKFNVKVANKQYATVKNDYEIHCDGRTEVDEAADQGGIEVVVKADIVPLDRLLGYIGRKTSVDVVGVVLSVGQLGTVKRRADNSELPRRDVTLGDSSGRSVVVTLWNDNANNHLLNGAEGEVLQVTSIRVGDFNGCSASSGVRSILTLNPDTTEGRALRDWYASEGHSVNFTPLGQSTGGGAGGEGGRRGSKINFLSDVVVAPGQDVPAPDAKPTYGTLHATVVAINPDQTMYYLANPVSGKKVVEQDGRYYCEAEGKYIDAAEHRYVLSCKVADATGETFVNMFNNEAQAVLGVSADDMAAMRQGGEEGEARYKETLKAARWQTWVMSMQARSREYQGERRMRYTAMQVYPLDFAAESAKLLAMINSMTS